MDTILEYHFGNLQSKNRNEQYEAFQAIMTATENKVDWAYEVWDELKEDLTHKDQHRRARAAQFLSNLALSDPENRIMEDFPAIEAVTRDDKFVTARHSLQAIWRIGLAGDEQKQMVVDSLENRYLQSGEEANYTLIRYDIIKDLRNLYRATNDESIKEKAETLIEKEEDPKYRKKYASVWKAKQ
ncbi:hypothetical protein [Alteribacillus sp. HJP-4]|uniref:hypothetical protein n=1 Tax=Alteribacillus sp. HJP-4 TaxID=2775394 RepID=UPI0035CD01DB